MDVASLVGVGKLLLFTKWFAVSMYGMWIYDYFLTLGDEIKFAWSGRKSWIFALFVTNRYLPVLHIIYKFLALFKFANSGFCRAGRWETILYTTLVIVLAQMTVGIRVYAVTGRRKLLGILFCALIAAQFGFGLYFTVRDGKHSAQKLPDINLDAYKICLAQRWRPGEVIFTSITMAFDVFAFLIISVAARASGTVMHPGIPNIFGVIVRDATLYFLVMFANQLVLFLFLFFAPVQLQLTPGITQVLLLPTLTSRMMLSLKQAAVEPAGMWSLSTMGDFDRGRSPRGNGVILFASRTYDPSWGTSEPSTLPSEGDMELGPVPRPSQNRGSQEPC